MDRARRHLSAILLQYSIELVLRVAAFGLLLPLLRKQCCLLGLQLSSHLTRLRIASTTNARLNCLKCMPTMFMLLIKYERQVAWAGICHVTV